MRTRFLGGRPHPTLGIVLLPLFAGLASACSSPSGQNGANQKAAAYDSKDADEDDDSKGSNDEDEGGDEGSSDDATSAGSDEVFTLFCERAAETKAIQEQLSEQFDKLCQGGKPTKLLTSVLVKSAFSGSGDPSLKKAADWEEDKSAKTTTGFFGVGIKLPIGIDEHFDKIAVKGGEEASINAISEAAGGQAEIGKALEEHKDDGPYQVRGWTIEAKASREIEAIKTKVSTHTIARSDQYELEKGSAYLYTQYLVESKETIKDLKMVTAGLKIGKDSYLLTVSRVVIENKGFHPVAMDSIKQSAIGLTKAMLDATKDSN